MANMDELEHELRSKPLLDRELAARQLLAAGARGWAVLAAVAIDTGAPSSARVTALQSLPEEGPIEDTLRALLDDSSAVIRIVALLKAERANARALAPAVEKLTTDPSVVWDLDQEYVVATEAERVLAALRR